MKTLVIFALVLVAVSAERYIPNSRDPANPGDCYHKDYKTTIKHGETFRPTNVGECAEFNCMADGLIRVNECGYYPTFDYCKITPTDYTKTYPACCASARCDSTFQ